MRRMLTTPLRFATVIWLSLVLAPSPADASAFQLPVLDTSMTDPIFRTLAHGFIFRPMEPASDLGKLWGFYVGVSGTATSASAISSIVSGLKTSYFPSATLQFGIGLPKGITLEGGVIPSITYEGTSVNQYAGRLKWTMTRSLFPKLPFSAALAVGYATTNLNYSQSLSGGSVDVAYKSGIFNVLLLVSEPVGWTFLGLEPYAGVGLANATSTLSGTGTATLFGNTFTAGTTSTNAGSFCPWLQAGVLLRLGILGIAGEYDSVFSLTSWNLKASLRI